MFINSKKLLLFFLISISVIFHFNLALAITDTNGPEISDFRFEEKGQVLKAGDTLHISVIITDESEIENTDVAIFRGSENWASMDVSLEYNNNTGRWECLYTITNNDKSGNYYISSVWAIDIYGNQAYISPSENNYFTINIPISELTTTPTPTLDPDETETPTPEPDETETPTPEPDENEDLYYDLEKRGKHRFETSWQTVFKFIIKRKTNDDETFRKFIGILIDDLWIDSRYYKVRPGSVIIEINNDYMLNTFFEGDHILTVVFEDGEAKIPFTLVNLGIVVQHEEPVVVGFPEDEIGSYEIGPNGEKHYLIYQTYDICMNYLGSDELCSGSEHCYHK